MARFYTLPTARIAGSLGPAFADGFFGEGVWQFSTDYYVPAKLQPQIIHPRPDGETNNWERHRLAPSGVPLSFPVAVQGGGWPFFYTLVDAPAGMTIGNFLVEQSGVFVSDSAYGVISWPDPVVGTHSVTVRVETQDFQRQINGRLDSEWGYLERTFSLSVVDREDTTKFIWLDNLGNDTTGDGSYSNPFATLSKVYDTTSYGLRQVHLKAGVYPSDAAGQIQLTGTTKPGVLVGHGDCEISLTQRTFAFLSGSYVSGVEVTNGGFSNANIRAFQMNGGLSRCTFFDVHFTDMVHGTVGDDNACSIWADNNPQRNYVTIHSCSDIGRYSSAGNDTTLACLYRVSNLLIENCHIDGHTAVGLYPKDGIVNYTLRNCYAKNTRGVALATGCQQTGVVTTENEICYNVGVGRCRMNVASHNPAGPHYLYRNIISDAVTIFGNDTNGPYVIEANAISGTVPTGTHIILTDSELNNVASFSTETFTLIDPYRADWLGQRGNELKRGA